MFSRRIVASRPLLRAAVGCTRRLPLVQQRCLSQADIDDPDMNGGYINPPRIKRQFRDPYGDWWDPIERRNYGEPVHEDNDLLSMFSPYEYTHTPPGKGALQLLCFVSVVLGLSYVVSFNYPDRPTVPKEYEGGLEEELGGSAAVRAQAPGDPFDKKFI